MFLKSLSVIYIQLNFGGSVIKRVLVILIITLIGCVLSGCMVGPDYQRPELALPSSWRIELSEAKDLSQTKWWEQFKDHDLVQLIDKALKQNLDLLRATFAVEEFYARYGISRSEIFPEINGSASFRREKQSGALGFPGFDTPRDIYSTTLSLVWELDIWGRIRRANQAARADLLSQEAARRGVILTLVTSVASSYVNLRQLDRQLEITNNTLKAREGVLKIIEERFKAGVVPELDVKQSESEVLTAKAAIPVILSAIARTENQLSLLVGENPGNISRTRKLDELVNTLEIPKGLPSDLLEKRPDIVQAEATLSAATSRIGVAKGEYFPRFSLTGDFGFVSTEFSDWLERSSQTWGFGPQLSLPIFTAGRIGDQVDAAEASFQQALFQYKRSLLNGLREVNDALVVNKNNEEKLKHLSKQVEVLGRYLDLAKQRYDEGQTSYLEVLDAERRFFQSQLEEADAQNDRIQSVIELFRALGGGWVSEADKITIQPLDR